MKSITDAFGNEPGDAIPKFGSGFCKGIGKTGEDICGTVVGGVIAIGFLYGRETGAVDNSHVSGLAAEFRGRFLETYGTTNCAALMTKFGEQDKMNKCKQMTANAAGMLADMLFEKQGKDQ